MTEGYKERWAKTYTHTQTHVCARARKWGIKIKGFQLPLTDSEDESHY